LKIANLAAFTPRLQLSASAQQQNEQHHDQDHNTPGPQKEAAATTVSAHSNAAGRQ
jgi:hypothetical protein